MSAQHTPGRLKAIKHSIYSDDEGHSVAMTFLISQSEHDEANARRLVACWNACEGISTESLESGQPMMAVFQKEQSRADRAEVGRDELLAALKHIASHGNKMDFDAVAYARAAIAKAGGEV